MFPITDFNFVFCSIATVAATVGYAFTRKQGGAEIPSSPLSSEDTMSNQGPSSSAPSMSAPEKAGSVLAQAPAGAGSKEPEATSNFNSLRRDSLKRKVPHDGFDEPTPDTGYPFNLANIYPNKRSRTPPSRSDGGSDLNVKTNTHNNLQVSSSESPNAVLQQQAVVSTPQDVEIPSEYPEPLNTQAKCQDAPSFDRNPNNLESSSERTPAPEPPRTPSPAPALTPSAPVNANANANAMDETVAVSAMQATPGPVLAATRPLTPQPAFGFKSTSSTMMTMTPRFGSSSSVMSTPGSGFAAFAGSTTSPFASVSRKTTATAFSSQSSTSSLWGSSNNRNNDNSAGADVFGFPNASANNNALAEGSGKGNDDDDGAESEHAIGVAAIVKPNANFTHITGEESEDVEQELKGVKLYVKRGNKPFASGMSGHLKLLSDRKTLAERLLFRREPLWQVSMNVKVDKRLRCTYEEEENAIRLVVKEPVLSSNAFSSSSSPSPKLELVVYALKPGRACSKQDFREFAESLLKNAQFTDSKEETAQPRVVAFSA